MIEGEMLESADEWLEEEPAEKPKKKKFGFGFGRKKKRAEIPADEELPEETEAVSAEETVEEPAEEPAEAEPEVVAAPVVEAPVQVIAEEKKIVKTVPVMARTWLMRLTACSKLSETPLSAARNRLPKLWR